MLLRVDDIHPAAQEGVGPAPGFKGPRVGKAVNSEGHAGHHPDAVFRQGPGQFHGHLLSVARALSRAHHCTEVFLRTGQGPLVVEKVRGIIYLREFRRIGRVEGSH